MQSVAPLDNPQALLANWRAMTHDYWSEDCVDTLTIALSLHGETFAQYPEQAKIGLSAADTLVKLRMDHESVIAVLMLACEMQLKHIDKPSIDLAKHFDADQISLIEHVNDFNRFAVLYQAKDNDLARLEDLRQLLITMSEDIRAIIVKIAFGLGQLREVKHLPEDLHAPLAKEMMDIYAPLANRLGIGQIKWEMEDLAFKLIQPEQYKTIASSIAEKREEREAYIRSVTDRVQRELEHAEISGKVYGRAKHIYSIYRKMQKKHLSFEQLFDVRAVRVITDTIENCYRIMTMIHSLWRDIPTEFDDYISSPKPNGYQSLHTAVIGPYGRTVEIQIRTEEMHERAERGVAAHWLYKEGGSASGQLERQIDWLRDILEHKDASQSSEDLIELFKSEIHHERLYVITPKGDLINLPKPSTPLDFAYYVHTDIGHRCRGAKVNGRIVTLTSELQSGDRVEVMTAKVGEPSRDWLQPHLGYLKTTRARSKVRNWFRQQNKQVAIETGRTELEAAFKRLGMSFKNVPWEEVAQKLNYKASDGLFAGFGNDEYSFNRLLSALPKAITASVIESQESSLEAELKIRPQPTGSSEVINVQGVGNLMIQMAKCCNPIPPDPIIGFVTLTRGISVHRRDCSNLLNMETYHKERFINISWQDDAQQRHAVDIQLNAISRSKLFYDISALLSAENIDILSFNTHQPKDEQITQLLITIEIDNVYALNRIMDKLNQIPGILSVNRRTGR